MSTAFFNPYAICFHLGKRQLGHRPEGRPGGRFGDRLGGRPDVSGPRYPPGPAYPPLTFDAFAFKNYCTWKVMFLQEIAS